LLAGVHCVDHMQRCAPRVTQLKRLELLWNDPDHLSAALNHGISHGPHEAHTPATEDQADAILCKRMSELEGGLSIDGVNLVRGGAVDSNSAEGVHGRTDNL
jgi:hypothetical protein